jgi:hypothetical protein
MRALACLAALGLVLAAQPAAASLYVFSTGDPDGKMAALSRPASTGLVETETADDFVLTQKTQINAATFTGLVRDFTGLGASPSQVVVEIYRVFPADSDASRAAQVPTRKNSPSDVALDSLDSAGGDLSFTTTSLGAFAAADSVVNGIFPSPGFHTGGDGPVTGAEERFSVDFTTPFQLAPGHYFFVPQVAVTGGDFLWLSAPRPIMPPGTAFPTGFTDLQAWIRNEPLAPDWLRVGTDIVGGTTAFNMTFSLNGATVPEPGVWGLLVLGFVGAGAVLRRRRAVA